MERKLNRLNALGIKRATKKGLHADGGGLYLRIAEGGTKGWIFRYVRNGRARDMGLGSINALSLAQARERAAECRTFLANDIDPIQRREVERQSQELTAAKTKTFRQCAEAFIDSHEASWTNATHRRQWRVSLEQHVYPALGSVQADKIDTALVMKAIEPIWRKRNTTAARLRTRIESILDWAKTMGCRTGENPARWRGHLENLLPKPKRVHRIKHFVALPYMDIGAFLEKLRYRDSDQSRLLQFLILTGARSGEATHATWDEIDLEAKTWTIPATRMKAKADHRVPLSEDALAILEKMKESRQGDYVFPSWRQGRPMSHRTIRVLAQEIAADDAITVHGFRSTFRDWAAERTNFPREIAEKALAHAIGDETERAYQRGDLFEKRRRLMDAWAQFCSTPVADNTVVPISSVMK
jgi:integrase